MTPWETIRDSRDYQSLSDDDKASVRLGWLSENLITHPDFQALSERDRLDALNAWEYENGVDRSRTVGGTIKDVGVALGKGFVDVTESMMGLSGIASKGLEKILPIREEFLQPRKDAFTTQDARQELESLYSPAQQEAERKVAGAEGFWSTLKEMAKNPSTIATTVIESAPSMIAGGGVGRGLVALGAKPLIAGAAGEGIISAGQQAEQARLESKEKKLTGKQAGMAAVSGALTGLISVIGGRLAKKMGFADIDTMLAKTGATKTRQGIVKRIAGGGFTEGVIEELPQSAQEQLFQNAATGKPLMEGVGKAGAQGMVAGIAMGVAANLFSKKGKSPKLTREQIHNALVSGKLSPEKASEIKLKYPDLAETVDGALKDYREGRPNAPEIKTEQVDEFEKRKREFVEPTKLARERNQEIIDAVDLDLLAEAEQSVERQKAEVEKKESGIAEEAMIADRTTARRRFKALSSIWDTLSESEQDRAMELVLPQKEPPEIIKERQAKAETQEFRRATPEQRAIEAQRKLKEADRLGLELDNRAELERQAAYKPEKPKQELQKVGKWVEPTMEAEDAKGVRESLEDQGRGNVEERISAPQERGIQEGGGEQVRVREPEDAGVSSEKEIKQVHDYSSTQINLPMKQAEKIREVALRIPESEIYTEPNDDSYGRENEPHITIRYGLETNNPNDVAPAFKNIGPIKAKFGSVSTFETDKYDVVKVDIESQDLIKANKSIGDTVKLPGETFKDYKPHATIAYVKKGEGKKYIGDKSLEGQEIVVDTIMLSGKDGKMYPIKLSGKKPINDLGKSGRRKIAGAYGEVGEVDTRTAEERVAQGERRKPKDGGFQYKTGLERKATSKETVSPSDAIDILKKDGELSFGEGGHRLVPTEGEINEQRSRIKSLRSINKKSVATQYKEKIDSIDKEITTTYGKQLTLENMVKRESIGYDERAKLVDRARSLDKKIAELAKQRRDEAAFNEAVSRRTKNKIEIKKLKDTLKNEKGSSQLYTDIINHGISLKQKGIDTYEKFKVRMFQKFRKVWDKIKGHMRELWNILSNQRGAINLEGKQYKDLKSFEEKTKSDLGLKQFDLFFRNNGDIELSLLIVDRKNRHQGVGSEAMKRLVEYADRNGKRVFLNPAIKDEYHGTTSRSRLIKFYKRFGFVENKGRNKDFTLPPGMFREPKISKGPLGILKNQRGELKIERPKNENIDELIKEIINDKPAKNKKAKEDLRSDHHDSIGIVGNILKSGKSFLFPGELTRKGKKDLSYFGDLLISVPEFFKQKIGAVERIYNASQEKLDEFHEHIYHLENHDDINSITLLKKLSKEIQKKIQDYLVHVDQTGDGFRINLTDNKWNVVDPKGKILKSFKSDILKDGRDLGEIQAVEEMIKSETAHLIKSGFDEKSANAIAAFRLSTNKGFEILFASMRKLLADARENGLEEPTFEVMTEGKKERLSIQDAMARMGDIRGTYFPRIRKRGQYILTAIKGDERILKTYNSKRIMSVAKSGFERKGFTVETSQNKQLGEDVFELSGDLIKTQQLIDAALGRAEKAMSGPWLENENDLTKFIEQNIKDLQGLFQSALTEQIANVIKERGFRAHMTKRSEKVWKGYEEDPAVALSKYIRGIAGGESKRNMTMKMLHAMTGTDISWQEFRDSKKDGKAEYKEYMDFVRERMISAKDQKNAFKWAKSYIAEMTRNREVADEIIGAIKGIAVSKYLAFRVFSAPVVNLTALPTSVVATLKGAGIPYIKSWTNLASAIKKYGQFIQFQKTGKTSDWIFQTIKEKGWDNPQYNSEALTVLRSQVGRAGDWIIDKGMWTFSESERLNRVATIYAAFKGLKPIRKGKTDIEILNEAKELSDKSHGVYNNGNYPFIVMGKNPAAQLLKMFYVFKTFSHTYLLNMRRLGMEKQWGAVAHMVISPAVLAGVGASVMTPIVNQVLKAFGADDPEEELYKKIGDSFGPAFENFARHGAFGMGGAPIGVSIKGSLSIGIGDLPTRLEDLFGAPGSIAKDIGYGAKSLARGDTLKGAEKLLPTGIGNIIRGYREYTEGVTTKSNAPKFYGAEPIKASRAEAFLRGMSFNPSRLARISEEQWSERKVESKYREWRTDIYAKVKRLIIEGISDDDKWSEIIGEIENYNSRAGQYGFPLISPKSIRRNIRMNFRPSKRERMK